MFDEILESLKPYLSIQVLASTNAESQVDASTELTNLFSTLMVQDLAQDDDIPEDIDSDDRSQATITGRQRYIPEVDPDSELKMKFFCLIEDAEKIFLHISEIYGGGYGVSVPPGHPAVAATLAEAAIVLIGQRETVLREEIADTGSGFSPSIAYNPLERLWLPSILLRDVSQKRCDEGADYRIGIKPLRFRVPNHMPNSPQGPLLLESERYELYNNLDTSLIQFMLDLNLETVSWSSL